MAARPHGPRRPWEGRRVVLGVTGGIAAYKSIQLARDLTLLGSEVDVVLTPGAREFVTPLSFQAVTGRPVLEEMFSVDGAARHIRLARDAHAVLVAPATADFLARGAHGRGDGLLATVLLATRAPVLLAPAMNPAMWDHPLTRENAQRCRDVAGYTLVGPASGRMAAGEESGEGRMVEPEELVEWVGRALSAPGQLQGREVLITAGPTHEPLDPVRYLGNRSSGKMGYALAWAAWRRGARVTLISGPTQLTPPPESQLVSVETALEMKDAAESAAPAADLLIFAAAVADFRPIQSTSEKWKRAGEEAKLELSLTANPDVSQAAMARARPQAVSVGFALETHDLLARAEEKRERKGFHLLVANPALEEGAGFQSDTNRVTLLGPEGRTEALELLSKHEVAELILDRVMELGLPG
ncbi:MAG: bifunctional phosphopantothenoylcysteine decarboxylase/phosphopantothenate--cysteine ligase CoaBC [Gemmatimonadota bacterium]